MQMNDCPSCEIVSGKRPSPGGVIYENKYWHVDSVARPVLWHGFLIIKLKRHCEQIAELTAEEASTLGPIIQTTCQALTETLHPDQSP
jgi:diadenosine tetraphosphate (Ap4A) HIT family hydrolase